MVARLSLLMLLVACLAAPALAQEPPEPPQAPRAVAPRPPRPPVVFGFRLDDTEPPVVIEVLPGSPVARAGIQGGDVLVSVDGRSATVQRVQSLARRIEPGDTVRFRVRQGGREREIVVVPDVRRPAPTPRPARARDRGRVVVIDPDSIRAMVELYLDGARGALDELRDMKLELDLGEGTHAYRFQFDSLGEVVEKQMRAIEPQLRELGEVRVDLPDLEFELQGFGGLPGARLTDLNPELARYFPGAQGGMLVLSVRADSRAGRAGLQAGDVIVAVDGDAVRDLGDLRRALRPPGDTHRLEVVRRGERLTLRVEPPADPDR